METLKPSALATWSWMTGCSCLWSPIRTTCLAPELVIGTSDSGSKHMPHSSTIHCWILSQELAILGLPAVAHVHRIIWTPDSSRAHRSACPINYKGKKEMYNVDLTLSSVVSNAENAKILDSRIIRILQAMKTHLTYFAILINIFFTNRFAPCFVLSKTFSKCPQLLCIWANATSNQVMKRDRPYLFAGHFKFILTSCDSGWFQFVRNWEFLLLNLITVNSQDFQTRDFHKILWKKKTRFSKCFRWIYAHCVLRKRMRTGRESSAE